MQTIPSSVQLRGPGLGVGPLGVGPGVGSGSFGVGPGDGSSFGEGLGPFGVGPGIGSSIIGSLGPSSVAKGNRASTDEPRKQPNLHASRVHLSQSNCAIHLFGQVASPLQARSQPWKQPHLVLKQL